jgi:hypothetical protein
MAEKKLSLLGTRWRRYKAGVPLVGLNDEASTIDVVR